MGRKRSSTGTQGRLCCDCEGSRMCDDCECTEGQGWPHCPMKTSACETREYHEAFATVGASVVISGRWKVLTG
jgi:hypothetical protein